ncbi:MAG: Ig-like domain-containing protein [Bacillota bacterium]
MTGNKKWGVIAVVILMVLASVPGAAVSGYSMEDAVVLETVIYDGEGNAFGDAVGDKLIFVFNGDIKIDDDEEAIEALLRYGISNVRTLRTNGWISCHIKDNVLTLTVTRTFSPVNNITSWLVYAVSNLVDTEKGNAVLVPAAGVAIKDKYEVVKVADIQYIAVKYGTEYKDITFPQTVNVTLNDGSKINAKLDWAKDVNPPYNGEKPGAYIFRGSLVDLPGNIINPENLKAEVIVAVQAPVVTLQSVIYEGQGVDFGNAVGDKLIFVFEDNIIVDAGAEAITVPLQNGNAGSINLRAVSFPVPPHEWIEYRIKDNVLTLTVTRTFNPVVNITGWRVFAVTNVLEANERNAVIVPDAGVAITDKFAVASMAALKDISVACGTAYQDIPFPQTVSVTLNDGSKINVGIAWNTAADPLYDPQKTGTYAFTGILTGIPHNVTNPQGLTARVNVIVKTKAVKETGKTVRIKPQTLNLRAQGRWISVSIKTANPDVKDLDPKTVRLVYQGKEVKAAWGKVQKGKLMLKFDRAAVSAMLEAGDAVEVFIEYEGNGVSFRGSDVIRVINPGAVNSKRKG